MESRKQCRAITKLLPIAINKKFRFLLLHWNYLYTTPRSTHKYNFLGSDSVCLPMTSFSQLAQIKNFTAPCGIGFACCCCFSKSSILAASGAGLVKTVGACWITFLEKPMFSKEKICGMLHQTPTSSTLPPLEGISSCVSVYKKYVRSSTWW